jgi:G3E family GTPase
MANSRFIMIGGFLGAGKTTTISRLARHFQEQGLRVGIVTNDQATDLVDTHTLRSQGFDVGEVPGSCFCCNFNALTSTVEQLGEKNFPDIILAEPVGSCTDLVATVVRPLQQIYKRPVDVAPYGVILKPSHGLRILRAEPNSGFSPKAAYIFRKQLEEADFVLINRVDELSGSEVDELERLIAYHYPTTPVIRFAARTGVGFDELLRALEQTTASGAREMTVDYDIYAEGEAELGWLNSSLVVAGKQPFELDALLLDIVERLQRALAAEQAETAHLKAIGMSEAVYGVANLVSGDSPVELSLPSSSFVPTVQVIVNARVAIDPDRLKQLVEAAVAESCTALGVTAKFEQTQSFRPGRPVPTHRILESSKS